MRLSEDDVRAKFITPLPSSLVLAINIFPPAVKRMRDVAFVIKSKGRAVPSDFLDAAINGEFPSWPPPPALPSGAIKPPAFPDALEVGGLL